MKHRSRSPAKLCALLAFSLVAIPALAAAVQPDGFDLVGINQLRQSDPNLTGHTTTVAVVSRSITYIDGRPQNDYRPDVNQACFAQTIFNVYNDTDPPAGVSEHCTEICSLLFGKDSDAYEPSLGAFNYRGVVCDANAQVFEFWYFLKNKVFDNVRPDADVISISTGSAFEDWWTRGIEAIAEQYSTVIVAGIGNGEAANDPPLYPAASSNVIAVGVLQGVASDNSPNAPDRFLVSQPEKSTCGPTADDRCKPDLVAPGNYLVAAAGEPNHYQLCGSYSSFATPVVAGTAALLIQKARTQNDAAELLSADGGNCIIKAILMNTASKLPYWHKGKLTKDDDHEAPLDFMQGAGALDALAAYNTLLAGPQQSGEVDTQGWNLGTVQAGNGENSYRFTVPEPSDKMITVTIAWNRHYQTKYPFEPIPAKDNDLRLELWAVGNDGNEVLLDYSDSRVDNVQHIYCRTDPNYSRYEISVELTEPGDDQASENYGIAWRLTEPVNDKSPAFYDLNGDGKTDRQDMIMLLANSVKCLNGSSDYLVGDINNDGTIDIKDISEFAAYVQPNFR
jgi:hypothetical protein